MSTIIQTVRRHNVPMPAREVTACKGTQCLFVFKGTQCLLCFQRYSVFALFSKVLSVCFVFKGTQCLLCFQRYSVFALFSVLC